jgi:hypothetical protein
MLRTITRASARLTARRALRLHSRVRQRPTAAQAHLYADLGGYEPLTYSLDPDANGILRSLVLEYRPGPGFTFRDRAGWRHETVALPDGSRFEPLAPTTEPEPLRACDRR